MYSLTILVVRYSGLTLPHWVLNLFLAIVGNAGPSVVQLFSAFAIYYVSCDIYIYYLTPETNLFFVCMIQINSLDVDIEVFYC